MYNESYFRNEVITSLTYYEMLQGIKEGESKKDFRDTSGIMTRCGIPDAGWEGQQKCIYSKKASQENRCMYLKFNQFCDKIIRKEPCSEKET